MNLKITLFVALSVVIMQSIFAQSKGTKEVILKATNVERLLEASKTFEAEHEFNRAKAIEMAKENGWIIRKETDKMTMELQGVTEDGRPLYYITQNAVAAQSISTDEVHAGGSAGLDLDGTGMIVGEWDGGDVRTTHQEFNNTGSSRVIDKDGSGSSSSHATHVAGTLIAGGVNSSAKGMAYNATLHAYDWNNDESEMASAAAGGLLVSNHSYGFGAGWNWNGSSWDWLGNTNISSQEDYRFGFYGYYCVDWDNIALDAPYYLIVKSAGNDRGDGAGQSGHPQDGGADGYDCISYIGNAKNVLTVGATQDVNGGYNGNPASVNMSSFSSWGPADDGRIKPDISGNGVGLFSTYNGSNSDYESLNGTSMASPNVTGSLLLLQEHYEETHGGAMKAATLKALVIHTADEAGPYDGPDYMFGWGLMNTKTAAQVISDKGQTSYINEENLSNGSTYTLEVTASGNAPLIATIVWADPAGSPTSAQLDPTDPMLVNDLDITVSDGTSTYYPYKLDGQNPANAATTGDNDVDNVEKVFIENPNYGSYTITINHEGTISGGSQPFSLIVSGIEAGVFTAPRSLEATVVGNTVDLIWTKPAMAEPSSDLLNDGFESYTDFALDFAPWTQVDNDGSETYGIQNHTFTNQNYIGSFIIFNQSGVTPEAGFDPLSGWEARTGSKAAVCFSATTPPNDDWLISPQLTIDGSYTLTFWAKTITDAYDPERIKVGISNTGNNTGDFTIVSNGTYEEVPTTWTQYTYDLSSYNGDDIYFAINCVSNDAFALFIDDVLVTDAKGNVVYGNSFENDVIEVTTKREKGEWKRNESTVFKSITSPSKATLSGYKLYRTGQSDATYTINNIADTTFTDSDLSPGDYNYYVKAIYTSPSGESASSNVEEISVEYPPVASAQAILSCTENDGALKVLSNRDGTQTFYLTDNDGNELDSWTGDATTHTFTSLPDGIYRGKVVKLGNPSNLTSPADIYTLAATEIITQPANTYVAEGETATFTVIAEGEDLDYEWYKDGSLVTNGGNVSGAYTNELTIANISSTNEGTYQVTISGDCGTEVSNAVILSIGTGIFDTDGNQINIYPNPTKGHLNINFEERLADSYNIYDLAGKLIQSGKITNKNQKLQLNNQTNGIYMIELVFVDQILRTKIIIDK